MCGTKTRLVIQQDMFSVMSRRIRLRTSVSNSFVKKGRRLIGLLDKVEWGGSFSFVS